MSTLLTPSQQAALDHVTAYARTRREEAQQTIKYLCRMCDIAPDLFDAAVAALRTARVALHFHPDRPDPQLKTVAAALLECGLYKSQFETLLSNGSVSAHPGGERDLWEHRLFGGAYNREGSTNAHRPKYGSLNLFPHPDGPSPRFGSCYFMLKPAVTTRCTFTYTDSHQDPKEKGTLEEFDDILAALMTDIFLHDGALGQNDITIPQLFRHLATGLAPAPDFDPSRRAAARNLNHYIEAQVHGDVQLDHDVELLVADPSFKGTDVGEAIAGLAATYGFPLKWHAGFTMPVAEVPRDYRGPTMPSLAARVAPGGLLETSMIGPAVMDLRRRPDAWQDRGTPAEVLQELKLLWHVLVRFGKPWATNGHRSR
jgi:hypothetical protein